MKFNTQRFYLREEPFGGILFDKQKDKVFALNKTSYLICNQLSDGRSIKQINEFFKKKFKVNASKDVADTCTVLFEMNVVTK